MNNQLKQQIVAAFQKTLLPNQASIQQGSALLTKLKQYQGCCLMFMQITDDEGSSDQIRQAAAIQLKLTIEKRWKSKKTPPLSENEKNTIRQFLLTAFLRCHRNTKILPIYKVIVKTIIEYDWKEWMPANDVILQIQKDPTTATGCLYFLEAIFNAYCKLIEEERVFMENLIELIFPYLYEIFKQSPTLEIMYLISKIIWRGYKNSIKQKAQAESFKFMELLKYIIEYYDPNLASLHSAPIKKHTLEFYYFHSKKWAHRTIWRFIQSHANSVFHDTSVEFSKKWFQSFGELVVTLVMKQLTIPSIPKTKFFQIKSLVSITTFKYQLIDRYAEDLLFNYLISFILLTPKEEEMAKEEPLEYLRGEEDPVQDNTNVKSVATDLWIDLAGKRTASKTKPTKKKQQPALPKFLVPAMRYLKQNLEEGDMVHKEMAMYLLCKMHRVLIDVEQIKSDMPLLIKSYVLPHFNNEIMLLRARAAELFSEYGHIDFHDSSILKQAVEGIYLLMTTDSNPVVKLKASYAFQCVLKHKDAIDMVKPYLKEILSSYINLLNEYETESLVNSLEGIVAHFSDEIGVFAVELIKHLNNIFGRYCGIIKTENNYNVTIDVELAAGGCIETMKRIVDSPLTTETLKQIQPSIRSIIEIGFTKEGNDYCNDIMYLLCSYITKIPVISKEMWFFYPCLFYLCTGVQSPVPNKSQYSEIQQKIFDHFENAPGAELFNDTMPAIRSYIFKGIDVLTSENDFYGTNLFMLIFKTVDRLYEGTPEDETKATITALMTYILENGKEFDQLVGLMWQIIKRNMVTNEYRYLRVMNSQLICMCIYSAPVKFFEILEAEHSTEVIFNYIFHPDNLYLNEWEKQRIVLGLSRVLLVSPKPQSLVAQLPRIMDELNKHINQISEIRDEKQIDNEQESGDNTNGKEEDLDDDDFGADDFGGEADTYWEEPREDDFKTALDNIDEVEFYESAIKVFREQEPECYNQLMMKYSQEDLQTLNDSIIRSKEEFVKRRIDIIKNLTEMARKGIAY